jgi:1-acyl-sn-glycerol-3-phosphate acyltransferase
MIGNIFRFLNRAVINLLARVEIIDQELAKAVQGSHILVSNHLGFIDGFLLYYVSWHTDLIVIVAEKYEQNAIFRWLGRNMDIIFIDRYAADVRSFRQVYRRLKRGGVLAIAPEGTRSPTGGLIEGHMGAPYLAMKLRVPVVPAGIIGSQDRRLVLHWKKLRRPVIQVRFGEAFDLDELPQEGREAALQAGLDEIMCRIAYLLPPVHRGIYAGHPRLAALEAARMAENSVF